MKQVLLIGPVSDRLGGKGVAGIARHVEGLAMQLQEKGFKVTIWYHRQNKSLANDDITVIGDNYFVKFLRTLLGLISISLKGGFAKRGLTFFRVLIVAHQYAVLKKILRSKSFDLIHVHSLNSFAGNSLEVLKKEGFNLPRIVYSDHGFWQNPNLSSNPSNLFLKNIKCNINVASKIIYISEYAKEKLISNKLFNDKFVKIENPVLSIPNNQNGIVPISQEIKDFIQKCGEKKIVFFNGYTESIRIKKLDLLLDALEYNHKLGEGESVSLIAICNERAMDYIASKNWSFEVLPLRKQPMSVIHYLYHACACLVNPSLSESYGLVYIEALQYGKPIIGFYRVINEFKKSLGIDIGFGFNAINETKENLADLITKLLNKEWDKELIISRANELTWDKKIDKFISLYEHY